MAEAVQADVRRAIDDLAQLALPPPRYYSVPGKKGTVYFGLLRTDNKKIEMIANKWSQSMKIIADLLDDKQGQLLLEWLLLKLDTVTKKLETGRALHFDVLVSGLVRFGLFLVSRWSCLSH